MSAHCHHAGCANVDQIVNVRRYRRVLWTALLVNAAMFAVELGAGLLAGSLSLVADAADFAGDALNYGVSLAVLSAGLYWRARAAMVKAFSMLGFGLYVWCSAVWAVWHGRVPDASTMGIVGVLALLSNVAVAWLLYAFREGDANMRSVWLCSRNDAIGNLAVLVAAAGVVGTASAWPDLVVASLMATLAVHSGVQIMRQARDELRVDGLLLDTPRSDVSGFKAGGSTRFASRTFGQLLTAYQQCGRNDLSQRWHFLEVMHVVGQTNLSAHARVHWMMICLAWQSRNHAELSGQVLRLVLAPIGHLLGRLPLGNDGRAHTPLLKPMAVTPEVMATIRRFEDLNGFIVTPASPDAEGLRAEVSSERRSE